MSTCDFDRSILQASANQVSQVVLICFLKTEATSGLFPDRKAEDTEYFALVVATAFERCLKGFDFRRLRKQTIKGGVDWDVVATKLVAVGKENDRHFAEMAQELSQEIKDGKLQNLSLYSKKGECLRVGGSLSVSETKQAQTEALGTKDGRRRVLPLLIGVFLALASASMVVWWSLDRYVPAFVRATLPS